MTAYLPNCAKCKLTREERVCQSEGGKGPAFCPTLGMADSIKRGRESYQGSAIGEFARQASLQEAEGYMNRHVTPYVRYPAKPRLEEICEFAARMGYHRLGIAFCVGLRAEAATLSRVLESRGFEVVSVVCKVGCVPKEEIGVSDEEKVRPGTFEAMCNPITQAEVLNDADTDFNIVLGLCVGHDSLFFMHSKAPVTVLAAKDRVLGHNPLAALYTAGSYYERLLKG